MTHQHKLDDFMPWRAESYDLHDGYDHGEPPATIEHGPISIGSRRAGRTRSCSSARSS